MSQDHEYAASILKPLVAQGRHQRLSACRWYGDLLVKGELAGRDIFLGMQVRGDVVCCGVALTTEGIQRCDVMRAGVMWCAAVECVAVVWWGVVGCCRPRLFPEPSICPPLMPQQAQPLPPSCARRPCLVPVFPRAWYLPPHSPPAPSFCIPGAA